MSRSAALLVATWMSFTAASAVAAGSITGTVKLDGKAPERKDVNMQSDPFCASKPSTKEEELVVGAGGGLKNVVVRISKGAPAAPAPAGRNVVLDQAGCQYRPRVAVG